MTRLMALFAALATAAVGLQLGILEALLLWRGGFRLTAGDFAEIAASHAVLGLAVGVPLFLALRLAQRLSGRAQDAAAARAALGLAALGTLLSLGGLMVNVRWLPRLLDARSLAADAAMLAGATLVALAWTRRPWSRVGDRALLAACLALDAGAAWSVLRATSPPAAATSARETAPPTSAPDILIVLLDTLRADHLGAYGYPRPTSPRIDSLAREGVVFERAFSSTNWTRPAVASLFTSTMPSRHQVVDLYRALSPSTPLLAEVLSAQSYQTGCFTVGVNVEPQDGYGRGVDHFFVAASRRMAFRPPLMKDFVLRYFPGVRRAWSNPDDPRHLGDPETITDRALEWARGGAADRPLFLYVHYLGPHSPYLPPAPYERELGVGPPQERLANPPASLWAGPEALSAADRQQMIDQYDGEILWHDGEVGRLVDGLRGARRSRPLLMLLIADHGEGFGEHGVWGHNAGMFDEVVNIPLIAWSSDASLGPARIAAPVSLLDVAPTLVDFAGASIPAEFDGESLRALLEGRTPVDRVVHIENPLAREGGVRTTQWSYLEGETGAGEFRRWLYRAKDTAQRDDVSQQHPEVVERLARVVEERRKIDESRSRGSVGIELDAERREQLRALGYAD